MKVLWLTNIPSPYRVAFFNELGKQVALTVLFEKNISEERDVSWKEYLFENFEGILLKGKTTRVDGAFCLSVLGYLKKNDFDIFVVTNHSTLTGVLAVEYLKLKRIPFIMEVDGGFPKTGKGLKEKFKKHLISSASRWMSTGKVTDETLMFYGATKEKIYRYPFTSLYEKDILKTPIKSEEKKILRDELGIKERKMVLAVGRFIESKGFDILLEASKQLEKDIGIYIVGGEPTDRYKEYKQHYNLKNVHFEGFKRKDTLSQYYKAADVFVLPTRGDIWGLVINEAMAYGLPVITTDQCIAGVELVEECVNGYIVPVEDVNSIADQIKKAVHRRWQPEKILWGVKEYSIEKMVSTHIELFKSLQEECK
ncbi:MAG: glycosyltransferase family 4 protein [Eubacterium sp.]